MERIAAQRDAEKWTRQVPMEGTKREKELEAEAVNDWEESSRGGLEPKAEARKKPGHSPGIAGAGLEPASPAL